MTEIGEGSLEYWLLKQKKQEIPAYAGMTDWVCRLRGNDIINSVIPRKSFTCEGRRGDLIVEIATGTFVPSQ